MHKLLIFIGVVATLALTGCGTASDPTQDALPPPGLIYRPIIQQGNVVSQEQVNELLPGMSKRQVKFLLGTPMLSDVFHADRWDYVYTIGRGSTPSEIKRVTVLFEDDRLVRITGDLRPQPLDERAERKQEILVIVPNYIPDSQSLWRRALIALGLKPADT
ncbi:MAG: outer membrane protein assembly factor BamE [Sedimenticolaceae bacterium]